jgi:hypothetical protein
MALPLALPWIATAFFELIRWVIQYFGAMATYRAALGAAALVSFIAITTTFIFAVKALVSTIAYTLPPWMDAGRFLIPENLAICFGVMFSAKISRWVYDFSYRQINIFLKP